MTRIELAVLDMAGTTIADDGAVEDAFMTAMAQVLGEADLAGLAEIGQYVQTSMGQSKIVVFRHLLDGDEVLAQRANQAFEDAYGGHVSSGRIVPIPGAGEAIASLRSSGVKVALATGFSPTTQRAVIDAVGWTDAVDLQIASADAGRGRPYPDLPLTALLRLGIDDVRSLAVVGDTAADMLSGVRAGASVVAGVLTGAHDETALRGAGATHVLRSVVDLPALLTS
jgi:phosphoglycolate phosphatase